MTIEEKILLYAELTEQERLEVERYVFEHPELAGKLEEAKALEMLLRDASAVSDDVASDGALAFYAASRRLPEPPPKTRELLERIEQRISRDPNLQMRLEEMETRLEELERLHPAGEQYDRLILRTAGNRATGVPRTELSESKHPRKDHGPSSREHAQTDQEPQEEISPPMRVADPAHIRYLWRAAAVIVALAAVYSILFRVGRMNESEIERLARFDRAELVVEGFDAVRREDLSANGSTSEVLYLAALDQLSEAHQSFLGLFPRFDAARIDSASRLLRRVIEREPEDSFVAGEASYLLGKALLASGDVDQAREALRRVVDSRSRRGERAAAILDRLADE